jgi:hypothetical protein
MTTTERLALRIRRRDFGDGLICVPRTACRVLVKERSRLRNASLKVPY